METLRPRPEARYHLLFAPTLVLGDGGLHTLKGALRSKGAEALSFRSTMASLLLPFFRPPIGVLLKNIKYLTVCLLLEVTALRDG